MTSKHYDVLVGGGGAAGVAAAVGAASEGARTLLVERFGFLGGAATNANVLAYCGFWTQRDPPRMGVRGVGAEVLNELHHLGLDVTPLRTPTENWIVALDPEAVKLALDRVAGRHGVDCLLHSRVVEAECAEGRVQAVVVADHAGMREITADAFVDTSGQADLVALAGGDVSIPPDEVRQAASFPVRFGGIPAGIVIDRAAVREAIARLDGEEPGIRVRPEGGMFFRLPISADIWWLGIYVLTDGLNGVSLTRAEIAGRAMAWRAQQAFKDAVPGFAGAYISGTGPQVGIRAARTATPRLHLRAEAMLAGQLTDDGVALGCWPAEVHHGLSGSATTGSAATGPTTFHMMQSGRPRSTMCGSADAPSAAIRWSMARSASWGPPSRRAMRPAWPRRVPFRQAGRTAWPRSVRPCCDKARSYEMEP
jgi:glycine/D-amino acid oxidase-like deaminating enzyme